MKIKYFMLVIPFIISTALDAGQYKGRATIELPKKLCSKKDNKPKDRKIHIAAIEKAKKIAWNNYVGSFAQEKIDAYNSNKDIFMSNFDSYVDNNYKLLYAECSNQTRTYTVVINANIQEQQVNAKLREFSSTSQVRTDLKGKSIVAMVIPRQTDSADIFDEKINKQKEIRKSSQTDAAVIDDGTSLSTTESTVDRAGITTGGKTTRKATKRTYKIGDIQSAVSQISDVVRPFEMRVLQPSWLERQFTRNLGAEPFLKDVYDEFRGIKGDFGPNINPQTQDNIFFNTIDFNYLGRAQVNYILLGTVDTSVPKIDPDTGNYSADVLVNIQLYKIDMDFESAELVASVGPEIKTAFGTSDVIAANLALKKTFDEAINSLIYKL
ncbi:MAG: hypothetical protein VW963_08370 [Candidatus Neomarinimicrobiota bacterium]|jgi:hypothetical protein